MPTVGGCPQGFSLRCWGVFMFFMRFILFKHLFYLAQKNRWQMGCSIGYFTYIYIYIIFSYSKFKIYNKFLVMFSIVKKRPSSAFIRNLFQSPPKIRNKKRALPAKVHLPSKIGVRLFALTLQPWGFNRSKILVQHQEAVLPNVPAVPGSTLPSPSSPSGTFSERGGL